MLAGAGVVVVGALLKVHDVVGSSETSPIRIWNVIEWLGLPPPAPSDPSLLGPTLAILNAPAWISASGYGALMIAVFWLMVTIDRE
jgi:hypothetical protein